MISEPHYCSKKIELSVVRDAMMLMWRHCKTLFQMLAKPSGFAKCLEINVPITIATVPPDKFNQPQWPPNIPNPATVSGTTWEPAMTGALWVTHIEVKTKWRHFPDDISKCIFHDDVIKWKHFHFTGHLCGELTNPGEFLAQRPVTRNFDVVFDLRLNKRLSKQWWGWWFETQSNPLWRQCNAWMKKY